MDYDLDALIEKAKKNYREGNYFGSIEAANEAKSIDPEEPEAWWFLTLSHLALNQLEQAYKSASQVIELAPNFANGWARLGGILQKYYDDEVNEEAIIAFERAIEIEPSHLSALTSLSAIYRLNDSNDNAEKYKEIAILNKIDELEGLITRQLNRLGILHFSTKNFFEAIKIWERNVSDPSGMSLFNLGLVFNHTEVSQDADAIDIWRIALTRNVLTSSVEERLSELLPRLLDLAEDANNTCTTVLDNNFYYDIYLNPFELLNWEDSIDLTQEFDFKKSQKLRKRLIQEIELEDGEIFWLGGIKVGKSQAIKICDELHDESKRKFHALVFNYKPLLKFLSKGEHQHFCVDMNESPIELIKILDDISSNFKAWLSEPFSIQFDRVLAIAIRKRYFFVIEVLLDGRRWVESKYNEDCFKSAKKELNIMLSAFEPLEQKSDIHKISIEDIRQVLEYSGLLRILNLLPSYFWEQQDQAVRSIRDLAIDCCNQHDDAELSKKIIELTNLFEFKSEMFKQKIEEDVQAIEDIIARKKEDEVHLVVGSKKEPFSITEKGVTRGNSFISTKDLTSLRWGALLTRENNVISNDSLYVFTSINGSNISLQNTYLETDKNAETMNSGIVTAILTYLLPLVLSRIQDSLDKGINVQIGNLTLTKKGVQFESGWLIFASIKEISWRNYKAEAKNGQITIYDKHNTSISTAIKIREVNNAFLLLFLGKDRE